MGAVALRRRPRDVQRRGIPAAAAGGGRFRHRVDAGALGPVQAGGSADRDAALHQWRRHRSRGLFRPQP